MKYYKITKTTRDRNYSHTEVKIRQLTDSQYKKLVSTLPNGSKINEVSCAYVKRLEKFLKKASEISRRKREELRRLHIKD